MKTIEELREFLIKKLPDNALYLFGSRARGDNSPYSDVDIAIDGEIADYRVIPQIRYEIEESLLPYNVDLVLLSKTSYLQEIVKNEGVRWH